MEVINFLENENLVITKLKSYLKEFFDEKTLVINDTRAAIIPEVLPYIEFVGSYDQRILPILENTNIVFSDPFYDDIKSYYENFGLVDNVNILKIENKKEITLAKNLLNNKELKEKIKSSNYKRLVSFFVNDEIVELSNELNINMPVNKDIFLNANDKLLLKKNLEVLGLPTISGDYTNDKNTIEKYFNSNDRYLFKNPQGVSGYGFWDNKENKIEEIFDNYEGKELIIEKFVEKKGSPSVQFFIPENGGESVIFGVTDQILENGKIYLGNSSPSIYLEGIIGEELMKQSRKILEYIKFIGYTGFGGIDFIIDIENNIYASEVNARFTGATFPTITSMLLKGSLNEAWEFVNNEGDKTDINSFINNNCIKEREEKGVFPIGLSSLENWGKSNLLKFK